MAVLWQGSQISGLVYLGMTLARRPDQYRILEYANRSNWRRNVCVGTVRDMVCNVNRGDWRVYGYAVVGQSTDTIVVVDACYYFIYDDDGYMWGI